MIRARGILVGLVQAVLVLGVGCGKPGQESGTEAKAAASRTCSSFDLPNKGDKTWPAHSIKFEQADLASVLALYAEISGRSIIRGGNVPDLRISFSNQTAMTAPGALQALDTVLAAQGMAMVNLGTHYVKIVPDKEAHLEPGPTVELKPEDLPDSSSFLIYIVKLRRVAPSQAAAALAPFAKLPNSIVTVGTGKANRAAPGTPLPNLPAMLGLQDHSIVILRDYSSNVRRMLQVLEKMEQN